MKILQIDFKNYLADLDGQLKKAVTEIDTKQMYDLLKVFSGAKSSQKHGVCVFDFDGNPTFDRFEHKKAFQKYFAQLFEGKIVKFKDYREEHQLHLKKKGLSSF